MIALSIWKLSHSHTEKLSSVLCLPEKKILAPLLRLSEMLVIQFAFFSLGTVGTMTEGRLDTMQLDAGLQWR